MSVLLAIRFFNVECRISQLDIYTPPVAASSVNRSIGTWEERGNVSKSVSGLGLQ